MGQLGDLEQVGGDPAHERTGAVLVVEEKDRSCMWEKRAERMSASSAPPAGGPIGDDEVKDPLEQVGQQQGGHHGEEQAEQPLGSMCCMAYRRPEERPDPPVRMPSAQSISTGRWPGGA